MGVHLCSSCSSVLLFNPKSEIEPRMAGINTDVLIEMNQIPLHPCSSVKSVVKISEPRMAGTV
jgi:hypothetical protein